MCRVLVAIFALLFLFSGPSKQSHAAEETPVRIFAAASLTDVINTSLDEQNKADSTCHFQGVYGGSSSLARQILAGAPADIFISANKLWMEEIHKANLVSSEDQIILASNRLVLISPKKDVVVLSTSTGQKLLSLISNQMVAMGEPHTVPAGIYARQALSSLGIYETLSSQLIYTQNVRTVLAWVERGEALGIVYASDAALSDKATIGHVFSADSHDPIEYWAAHLSKENRCATEYFNSLKTSALDALFEQYGFLTIENKTKKPRLDY